MSEECGSRRRRKEAFEWIRKRESKGNGKREIYYSGAEFSRKDLKDAVRNCKESEKEACQRKEENRPATQGNGKETEADKRKQERNEKGKKGQGARKDMEQNQQGHKRSREKSRRTNKPTRKHTARQEGKKTMKGAKKRPRKKEKRGRKRNRKARETEVRRKGTERS